MQSATETATDTVNTTTGASPVPPPPPPSGGNLRFVKISEGQLKTKPSKDADYVEIEEVIGVLRRVAIRSIEWSGRTIESAEAEIESFDGVKNIVEVSTQNSVGCGQFMSGLCLLKEGETVCLRARPSQDKNAYGHYTTFINWMVYDSVKREWANIQTSPNLPGQTWVDRLPETREEFEALPFYKEREQGGGGGSEPGEYDLFIQTVAGDGRWKPVRGNEDAYLTWVNAAQGTEFLTIEDVEEDVWLEMRPLIAGAKRIPAALKA